MNRLHCPFIDGETVAYKLSEDSQIGWRKKSIGLDFEVG